jgi:transposase
MDHIGIDLGARHSHVVVISPSGQEQGRRRIETASLGAWLKARGPSRVVMEACTQSPAIARASLDAGHETRVVPGTLVRALGVGARGIKTDDRDAEVLARASQRSAELPTVHLRSEESRSRREQLAARATLVKARKSIALSVKSWLRGRLVVIRGRANSPAFCSAVRKAAQQHPDGLPESVEVLLRTFEHLCTQVDALDESIERVVEQEPVCRQLMQIPGVGPQVSLAFVTYIDDPERIVTASQLGSYLALVPGEATTGGKVVRTSTIKAGPAWLKALLVQAAWSMWRTRPNDPMVLWARGIADRRGKRVAIIALARKLATVMWAMWKHGTKYDPTRASSATMMPSTLPSDAAVKDSATR